MPPNEETPLLQSQRGVDRSVPVVVILNKFCWAFTGVVLVAVASIICSFCRLGGAAGPSSTNLFAIVPHLGIGVPVVNKETGIYTIMYWETRLFFALDPRVRSMLTLDNPLVSRAMFPDEDAPVSLDKTTIEERVDDYILLDGCPGASNIGLKARGGVFASLELKTTITQHGRHDDDGALSHWIKSRKKGHFNPTDIQVVLEFLADCKEEQPQAATAVMDYIQQKQASIQQHDEPLSIIRSSKRRRFAYIDNGAISVQEADVEFRLMGNHSSSDDKVLSFRSWSAEAVHDTAKLRAIAEHWQDRFANAVMATGLGNVTTIAGASPVPMWVASYPEMILQVPKLLQASADND